jgi:hypothetical protein
MLDVVAAIDRLAGVKQNSDRKNYRWLLLDAKNQLEALFGQSIYSPYLRASREQAAELHQCLAQMMDADDDKPLEDFDEWWLNHNKDRFKTVFLSELSTIPSFLVVGKEGYDTNALLDEGHKLFPAALRTKVPEAITDAREVGKALAYELATACGFRTFRVTECVIKRYWDSVSGGVDRPKLETIGSYAKEMEDRSIGDKKITESLKQMARLHRNPLIHPEVILTVEEAIDTLGIARSVIGAMLRVLPEVPPTTAMALQQQHETSVRHST